MRPPPDASVPRAEDAGLPGGRAFNAQGPTGNNYFFKKNKQMDAILFGK